MAADSPRLIVIALDSLSRNEYTLLPVTVVKNVALLAIGDAV